MKAKDINKAINWGLGFTAAYFIGTAIAGAIKKHREQSGANGIGKMDRIKRRIYKEVSLAQSAGVDFSKKYAELSKAELDALEHIGKDVVMWKQSKRSIESGKPYTESYYGSLRRAWNAVSGIQGIGRAYNVKDANGNVCLTWIEDAAAHVDAEQRTLEAERRAAEARKRLRKVRSSNTTTPIAPKAPKSVDDIRRELLDRAKLMQVAVYTDGKWEYISGEDRYKYLDQINYVVMVHDSSTSTSETTDYPVRSYPTKESAEDFAKQWRGKIMHSYSMTPYAVGNRQCKVYFIHDVPIQKITGIPGIGTLSTKNLLEPGLLLYIEQNTDFDDRFDTLDEMESRREPLYRVNRDLDGQITDLVEEWCIDNAIDSDSIWELVDTDDILYAVGANVPF